MSREVVSGVRERSVGADREVPGVQLKVVAKPKLSGRRRTRNVHFAVAVLHDIHVALQRPEKPDLLYLHEKYAQQAHLNSDRMF